MAFPGAGKVKGEIWAIPPEALLVLDIYEGVHEGIYERLRLQVETPQGQTEAWVYRATPQAMEDLKDKLRRVSGNDWRTWRRETTF